MFYQNQPDISKKKYLDLLQAIGSLSALFSDNDSPYLYYRAAERIFCRSFDAKYKKTGIGLKTFLHKNGSCIEKIAEFNSKSDTLRKLLSDKEKLIEKVIELRNKRIDFTKNSHNLNDGIYHCVSREKGKFLIHEIPLIPINLSKLKIHKKTLDKNSIVFNDNSYEYRFNLSKSTLYKRFDIKSSFLEEIDIPIIKDPFALLEGLLPNHYKQTKELERQFIVLPLYSVRTGEVSERSGLNQWNASGRTRNENEVYIPIPAWINQQFSNFFPEHDNSFNIILPDNNKISSKRCQENSKAIMSNPNTALGKWLLRDLLKIKEGVLCTKEMLDNIGIDSIILEKIDNENYKMNFMPSNSFEEFQTNYKK